MTALRRREDQITEITLTGGASGIGGPCFASAMNRTWHRAEGEGLATFQARVRAEALAIGADCITWAAAPTREAT